MVLPAACRPLPTPSPFTTGSSKSGPSSPRRCTRSTRTTSEASNPKGGKPYYTLPVFTEWNDRLFCRAIPPYILASQRHADAPRMTEVQKEALTRWSRWPTTPITTSRWSCIPATCSSSTTTTCSTAGRRTRRPVSRSGPSPQASVARDRSAHRSPSDLRQPEPLVGEKRTASRLDNCQVSCQPVPSSA